MAICGFLQMTSKRPNKAQPWDSSDNLFITQYTATNHKHNIIKQTNQGFTKKMHPHQGIAPVISAEMLTTWIMTYLLAIM